MFSNRMSLAIHAPARWPAPVYYPFAARAKLYEPYRLVFFVRKISAAGCATAAVRLCFYDYVAGILFLVRDG
jgi:hypothetical protein